MNNTTTPTALILADQPLNNELEEIFGEHEKSSLVIAGHSLIEHLLMELRDLNFQQVIILAQRDAEQLQQLIGKTRYWGMTINVMKLSLNKEQALREYKSLSEPNGLLVIEMNQLRSHCIEDFLNQAQKSDYLLLEGIASENRAGITLLKSTTSSFIINPMPIHLSKLKVNSLITSHDFHCANFDVVSGVYAGLEPSVQHNSNIGRRQHWASYTHKRSELKKDNLMIEKHCRIDKNSTLDSVILNHDVFIAQNTSLKNTIVMPNTIIAKKHTIKNAIVNNGNVYMIQ